VRLKTICAVLVDLLRHAKRSVNLALLSFLRLNGIKKELLQRTKINFATSAVIISRLKRDAMFVILLAKIWFVPIKNIEHVKSVVMD
jgi:hypothetical protein